MNRRPSRGGACIPSSPANIKHSQPLRRPEARRGLGDWVPQQQGTVGALFQRISTFLPDVTLSDDRLYLTATAGPARSAWLSRGQVPIGAGPFRAPPGPGRLARSPFRLPSLGLVAPRNLGEAGRISLAPSQLCPWRRSPAAPRFARGNLPRRCTRHYREFFRLALGSPSIRKASKLPPRSVVRLMDCSESQTLPVGKGRCCPGYGDAGAACPPTRRCISSRPGGSIYTTSAASPWAGADV